MLASLVLREAGIRAHNLGPATPLEALEVAEAALVLCRPTEHEVLQAAEIGLKARHSFCLTVAVLLETPPVDTTRADDWIMRATDKVDEAMQLTAQWEKQGAASPAPSTASSAWKSKSCARS